MKWMIASDIHGSAKYCRRLLEAYRQQGAQRLLLLGDILYHGPRNALPEEYAPMEVADMLNAMRDQIVCVRGNCDAEVDQMVLQFPIMADYEIVDMDGRIVLATHGHVYGEEQLPEGVSCDYVLAGHTHVPVRAQHDGYVFINPGSVSIPKEDSGHSCMIWDGTDFAMLDLGD